MNIDTAENVRLAPKSWQNDPLSNRFVVDMDSPLDENLSEDFLSEKASPSWIKTSLKLLKNMSHNPFKNSKYQMDIIDPDQSSENSEESNWNSRVGKTRNTLKAPVMVKEARLLCTPKSLNKGRKYSSQQYNSNPLGEKSKPSLMQDIHCLLKKAVEIRQKQTPLLEVPIDHFKGESSLEDPSNVRSCRKEKSITMRDVAQPKPK